MSKRLFCLAVVLAALLTSCRSSVPPLNVILISVDTLRPDHMGTYGYARPTTKAIDRWFGNGRVYEQAYSAASNTPPSVISFLSGVLAEEHGVRRFFQRVPAQMRLISDMLPDTYESAAFVSNMVLTDEATDLARHFDYYDDFVDEKEPYRNVYERNAARTTDAVLTWLSEKHDRARPLFLWIHYIDPHGPYHPPVDWQKSFKHAKPIKINPARVPGYQQEPGVDDGLTYVDLYDEEIAYLDTHVDRLLSGYEQAFGLDKTLIVFTADHGESMMEHERWFTHGYHVYDEIVRVPLMVRGPGVASQRYDQLVSTIDIAPTILAFAGVKPAEYMSAADLRLGTGLDPKREVFFEAGDGFTHVFRRAMRRQDTKWMLELAKDSCRDAKRIMFNLGSDPGELQPRDWGSDADAAVLLERCLSDPVPDGVPKVFAHGKSLSRPKLGPQVAPGVEPGVSPRNLEKLKALGYVE